MDPVVTELASATCSGRWSCDRAIIESSVRMRTHLNLKAGYSTGGQKVIIMVRISTLFCEYG